MYFVGKSIRRIWQKYIPFCETYFWSLVLFLLSFLLSIDECYKKQNPIYNTISALPICGLRTTVYHNIWCLRDHKLDVILNNPGLECLTEV